MPRLPAAILLAAFFLAAAPLRAIDYFVATTGNDNANGRAATTPFRTLSRAASLVNPGDTVTVANGTYNESLQLVRNGSATASVIFRAANRGGALIRGAVRILASHVDFSGFDVVNANLHGISVSGHHVRVLNNDVHDCSGNGIYIFSSDYITVEGNRSYRNGVENGRQASGLAVYQPLAFDQAPGFHLVIRGNQFFDNESRVNTRANNFTLGLGILLEDFRNTQDGSTAGVYRPATLVENNLLYGNVGRALVIVGSDNITVRHNTAANNLPVRNANTALGDFSATDADGVRWINNIVVSRGSPQLAVFDLRTTNTTWEKNIIWSGGISIAAGSPTVIGPTNYLLDPLLVAPATGNLRPGPGSFAIDNGTATLAATSDFEGSARPRGAGLDIGAFELAPAVVPPGAAPAIVAQPVGQTILSGGLATVSVAPAGSPPFTFQWSRNGTAIAGATLAAYTFPQLRPADAGNYTVRITNAAGTIVSEPAAIAVPSLPDFTWRYPLPPSSTLNTVAYGLGRWLAAGVGGRVLSSIDGVTWTLSATLPTTNIRGLATDGAQWVAVGDGGTVFTSRDAVAWTQRNAGNTNTLYAVAFINNLFVACGNNGTVTVSADGISWSTRTTGATQQLFALAGTLGRYVAVGQGGTILTSADAFVWTRAAPEGAVGDLYGIIHAAGQFIAVGASGAIQTSADGLVWTRRNSTQLTNNLRGVAFNGSQFILATDFERVAVTPNFAAFNVITIPHSPQIPRFAVAAANNLVVTVGSAGEITSSPDGVSWTQRGTAGGRWEQRHVAFLNSQWFVVGSSGGVFTSPDGVAWTRRTTPITNWLGAIAYGADRYVIVGDQGSVMTSPDGIVWTNATATSGTTQNLRGLIFSGGRFIAVGNGGTIRTSPDGRTWTAATSGITSMLYFVGRIGSTLVAGGDNGVLLTSPDGTTWTPATSGTTQQLRGFTVWRDTAYVVGNGRVVLSSANGQTWTLSTVPFLTGNSSNYRAVAPMNGGLIIAGDQGVNLFSIDGVNFTHQPLLAFSENLFAGASNGMGTVIAGTGGVILHSPNPSAVPSRLTNVATRGLVQPGEALTPGFVLRGSGTKQVVVRAVGPTLSLFGLPALADLKFDLVNQQTRANVASNDDWGGGAALSARFASLGAFPLAASSKDAAVQAALPVNSGGYSVRITANDTAASGVALAEVYDADGDDSPVRLANVSTLGFAGTGDNVLTPGFYIRGTVPKLVLIRAVGPGLAQFGVGGLLADPQISVFPAGAANAVATSNDWGGTPELKAHFAAAGAFALPDTSRDAALVATLPPGGYTVVASGVGNTSGIALVEVYDLDP